MSFEADYQQECKRQSNRGRCLHFVDGARCNKIISAHSIQNRGQLSMIAENGHVYRLNADLSTLKNTDGMPSLKKIGINKVSTFGGFCKYHDNILFKPIDDRLLNSDKHQIALYAYRCLCREYFVKENAVKVIEKMKNHPDLHPGWQPFLRNTIIGHSRGFQGLQYHKQYYDDALRHRRYDEFEYTYFISTSRCSLQLSGVLYPDFDFHGYRLQNLGNWSSPLDLITFFTAPTREGWAFGFAWHKSSSRTCLPFLGSLASSVANGEKMEDALLRFSLSCCENHAFRISWWDNLNESLKQIAIERMLLMIHPYIPVPANYLVNGCEGIADWSFEYVHTTLKVGA